MAPLRLSNVSYAILRLAGLVAMAVVFAVFCWLAWTTDQGWQIRAAALGTVGALLVWSLHAAMTVAWWVEVRDNGIRILTLLGRRTYDWSRIVEVRPMHVPAGLAHPAPMFGHEAIVITTSGGRRIVLCVARRDREAAAQHIGPRWSEKTWEWETNTSKRITVAIVVVIATAVFGILLSWLLRIVFK